MTANQIKNIIQDCATLFEFEYQEIYGNIDPYFHGNNTFSFLLYFNGKEKTVYSINEVMNNPFINGKSLNEVAEFLNVYNT